MEDSRAAKPLADQLGMGVVCVWSCMGVCDDCFCICGNSRNSFCDDESFSRSRAVFGVEPLVSGVEISRGDRRLRGHMLASRSDFSKLEMESLVDAWDCALFTFLGGRIC